MRPYKKLGELLGDWFDRYWLPVGLLAAVVLFAMSAAAWVAAVTA